MTNGEAMREAMILVQRALLQNDKNDALDIIEAALAAPVQVDIDHYKQFKAALKRATDERGEQHGWKFIDEYLEEPWSTIARNAVASSEELSSSTETDVKAESVQADLLPPLKITDDRPKYEWDGELPQDAIDRGVAADKARRTVQSEGWATMMYTMDELPVQAEVGAGRCLVHPDMGDEGYTIDGRVCCTICGTPLTVEAARPDVASAGFSEWWKQFESDVLAMGHVTWANREVAVTTRDFARMAWEAALRSAAGTGGASVGPIDNSLINRAKGWSESDLKRFPTATLELIDSLMAALASRRENKSIMQCDGKSIVGDGEKDNFPK